MAEVSGYLAGDGRLDRLEHNTIAQALNERFMDLGLNHPVPVRRIAPKSHDPRLSPSAQVTGFGLGAEALEGGLAADSQGGSDVTPAGTVEAGQAHRFVE